MKSFYFVFTLIALFWSNKLFAFDITVENADGVTIYYNYINDGKELEVTCYNNEKRYNREYEGNVVIPEEVTYMNRTRKVTSIGEYAFHDCWGLTSVTIGNSVTSIGDWAFSDCDGLTSVIIPNSVTSIGDWAFRDCDGLTSVTIGNSVTSIGEYAFSGCDGLTSVIIPNSVTSIGDRAFIYCSGLTSVIIPNSVTSIGSYAFSDCSGLISVTIGNSVTSIGEYAFHGCDHLTSVYISDIAAWCNINFGSNPLYYAHHLYLNGEEVKDLIIPNSVTSIGKNAFIYCSGLTSLTIPNSVTSIGSQAFYFCDGLTSVTIGNSVTSIGANAFSYCSGLTSVTIGNSVTSIGSYAFSDCSGLISVTIGNSVTSIGNNAFSRCKMSSIISLIRTPFNIAGRGSYRSPFDLDVFNNTTLFVPIGTIEKYKATEGWKDFLFIEEGTESNGGGGESPETKKCAKPTIGYQNGKLVFSCDTEGANFQYSITDDDVKSGSSNEIQLDVTYYISVYATKTGYEDSETATATLCWIDTEPKTEGITNVAQVRAKAVMIQSHGNVLSVSGVDEGTEINVYDTAGKKVGSQIATSDITNIATFLDSGSIGIIKIGEKAVKVLIK